MPKMTKSAPKTIIEREMTCDMLAGSFRSMAEKTRVKNGAQLLVTYKTVKGMYLIEK